ncbi:hypothetical protein SAMN02910339_01851 [Lachnospiraceae bacterium YSD2013]|nr:hypothetical protein SAMN02910339_01851 [Lachnospiraceae bacterium YSD2013]
MKNKTALIMSLAMAVMLTACGNKAAESTETAVDSHESAIELTEEAKEADESVKEEITEGATEETSAEAIEETEKPYADFNFEGCDTFTQIVDSKLENGWGYANESVGDTDVFFVSNGIFNDADGNAQAIDSLLFIYKDSVPAIVGQVSSTSTSCPVSIKDKVIYAGGNHGAEKYTVLNNELVRTEAAWVEYDSDGKETYYYQSGDGAETKQADSTEYDRLFEEFAEATPVYFSVVVK